MVNRVQTLRSSTSGARPSGRAPGELYVNWADNQLGVVNAAAAPVDLIAVRFFSPQATYSVGAYVIQAGVLYRATSAVAGAGAFNPSQWSAVTDAADIAGAYLPLTGGAITGPLTLPGNPGQPLQAAPKQYVDTFLPLAGGALSGPLTLPGNPASALQAAPKQYVDALSTMVTASFLPLAGGTLTGPLTLSGPPSASLHAATKAYVDTFLPIAGGTMLGPMTVFSDPSQPLQPATKQYVDNKFLPLAGGTLTGALTPAAAGIVGVTTATNANAGAVGEFLFTLITTGVPLTTATTATVGTLALPAGDWDISGELWLNISAGATILGGALAGTAAFPAGPAQNASRSQLAAAFTASNQILALAPCRTVAAAGFTVYLLASVTFASGTVTATGRILARRVR